MSAAVDKLEPKAAKLVQELRGPLGLNEVDALRAAFTVLAVRQGWSKARIGRYLGISRARVHQRVGKYESYAAASGFPVLKKTLNGKTPKPDHNGPDLAVSFHRSDWEDEDFAAGMLNRVVGKP